MLKRSIYGLIVLLAILHQDFWWWNDSETLVFGFLPIGLAYHALVSVAAGILWAMAVKFCWPKHIDPPQADRQGKRCNPPEAD